MASLKQLLLQRECKGGKPELTVYRDSKNIPTVGIGHKVVPADKLKVGDKIDEKRSDEFFKKDTAKAVAAARKQASTAGIQDSNFEVYLASVNFQLGTGWTGTFKKTWKLILDGKYPEAAKEAAKSSWNSQTPIRVKDFQGALLQLKPKPDK